MAATYCDSKVENIWKCALRFSQASEELLALSLRVHITDDLALQIEKARERRSFARNCLATACDQLDSELCPERAKTNMQVLRSISNGF